MVKQISASVGLNGTNVAQDVKIVQELLNKVPPAKGGAVPALKVDGLAWTKTTNAIKKFQHDCLNFKWPDGRIDAHGKTFQALSAFDQPAPSPQDSTQKDPKTQAEADKPQSVAWAMAAQAMLAFYEVLKLKQTPDPLGDKALIESALNTHFQRIQYAHLTPQQAIHNPSSYVAFAQHVFYRKDVRYGAGRANE
jgi:hypothetical protein